MRSSTGSRADNRPESSRSPAPCQSSAGCETCVRCSPGCGCQTRHRWKLLSFGWIRRQVLPDHRHRSVSCRRQQTERSPSLRPGCFRHPALASGKTAHPAFPRSDPLWQRQRSGRSQSGKPGPCQTGPRSALPGCRSACLRPSGHICCCTPSAHTGRSTGRRGSSPPHGFSRCRPWHDRGSGSCSEGPSERHSSWRTPYSPRRNPCRRAWSAPP